MSNQFQQSCKRFPWCVWRLLPSPSMSIEPVSRHAEFAEACESARAVFRECKRPTHVKHDSSTTVWFSVDLEKEINRNIYSETGRTPRDAELAQLRSSNERFQKALRHIAYEPLGDAEASDRQALEIATNIARLALDCGGGN